MSLKLTTPPASVPSVVATIRVMLVALALLLYGPKSAVAYNAFFSGNNLLELCNDPSMEGACLEYVAGVADVLSILVEDGSSLNGFRPCVPVAGVKVSQLSDIVVRYLRTHPEERHLTAASLVAKALSLAFPCAGDAAKHS